MKHAFAVFALLLGLAAWPGSVQADQDVTYKGPESASERAFVVAIQGDLMKRFPTAADAEKAGYVRYTGVDETGAISYANFHWQSADIKQPSQLWYDKNGKLLGADYSVAYTPGAARPQLWGVNPGRWVEFDSHMHWVTKDPATGKYTTISIRRTKRLRPQAAASITRPRRRSLRCTRSPTRIVS